MFECIIKYNNGTERTMNLEFEKKDYITNICISATSLSFEKVKTVDILLNNDKIKAGDEGFFLIPGGWWRAKLHNTAIGYFKEHEDFEYINQDPHMEVFGIHHKNKAYIAIATGMREVAYQMVKVCNNEYNMYFRYDIDCEKPYEDIKLEIRELKDDFSYSAMGREYRKYILDNGFVSMKDRLNSDLEYAADSMCIRVRMGWKPVPCQILEQTLENEPPMHVACTFKEVENLMFKYKEAGIEKAEFCLIGWNVKGHDGRWPEILPPEELLGGEKDLLQLINTAKKLGYTICCHTNSTDGYTIANNFTLDDVALKKDGSYSIEAERWAGGRTYNVCPKRAYEISAETLPEVSALGFRGTHYIDVITATPPRYCYNPKHPVNRKEACGYFDKLFDMARKLFGCVGCEVGFEHSMKNCDFILYAAMVNGLSYEVDKKVCDIFEEYVPFWHIVFHGIIINNPYSGTVNAIQNRNQDALLKLIELGGRPVIYYYSKFLSDGKDWMGDVDFRMDTPEAIESGIKNAKKTFDLYNSFSYLQYEFMESHEKISDNVYKVVYSDGSTVVVDYNQKTYKIMKGQKIK